MLLKLSLEKLEPSDWGHFEKFCSSFLISEFESTLRTMANPSGDGGRDSELFSPERKPFIALQYSVTKDWKKKIRSTAKRLKKEFPDVRVIIYMSPLEIGGQADTVRKELFEDLLMLDIRDRNWFLERANMDPMRESASEMLADAIARPFLAGEDIINKPTSPLTTNEAKAALTYLGLQWQDDISDKGLTKLSFEALVRSALRHTDSTNRLTRSQVYESVIKSLPSVDPVLVEPFIDSALSRLTKKYIRHWKKEDEYCLTHEEHTRILTRLAEIESQQNDFINVVESLCNDYLSDYEHYSENVINDLKVRIPRILEILFLRQGESFAIAVNLNKLDGIVLHDLNDIIINDLQEHTAQHSHLHYYPKIITTVIKSILNSSSESTNIYLRRLASAYTLFSFLNQTPDVQSATRKIFSHGTIWLDTTVILPLIAEQLESDPRSCKLGKVFEMCRNAGVRFRVTSGIIQEINAHMNNALTCSQFNYGEWKGRVPYLLRKYINSGQSSDKFYKWLSFFRGDERPDDDLTQYLEDVYNIQKQDLENEVENVNKEWKYAMDRLWSEVHEERRSSSITFSEETTRILIQHDIETYLGVIGLRQHEHISELGYKHWLLTFDTNAWVIKEKLREEFKDENLPSPLLSFSFLVNSITFGPSRGLVSKSLSNSLPLILDIEMSEPMSIDLLKTAQEVREENSEFPEYVIRRKVRDAVDQLRRQKSLNENNTHSELNDF